MEKLNSNVNFRQLFLYFALIAPVAKLIILPSTYSYYAGKDAYIDVAIQGTFDLITFFSIIFVMYKDGRGFFDIMKSLLGSVIAKIFAAFYFIFFLLKAFLPLIEILLLSITVFYSNASNLIIYLPIFVTLFYASIVGFNGQFRTVELLSPFIIFSFLGIIFLSLSSFDFLDVLPIFEFGFSPVGNSVTSHMPWFGDFAILLFLMNNTNKEKSCLS